MSVWQCEDHAFLLSVCVVPRASVVLDPIRIENKQMKTMSHKNSPRDSQIQKNEYKQQNYLGNEIQTTNAKMEQIYAFHVAVVDIILIR